MNREDELFIAKKTAERAGYRVTMPDDKKEQIKTDRVARRAHLDRNTYSAPSFADHLERLAQAARTAEEAGYHVRMMSQSERNAYQSKRTDTVEPKKTKEHGWSNIMRNSSKFLSSDED